MLRSSKKIQAAIFDWAGTTIDYGCIAPFKVFMDVFDSKKIPITSQEALQFMGVLKVDHIRRLFELPRISSLYTKVYGRAPDESTVQEFNKIFEEKFFKILTHYTNEIPGAFDTVNTLRGQGLKIGSTTGYTEEMMKVISPIIATKGYTPDYLITSTQVPQGRPFPYMMYLNAINLQIPSQDLMVKIGDSVADIKEGLNAGAWTVGIMEGSSTLGFTLEEFNRLSADNEGRDLINKKKNECKFAYKEAGVDYIINKISDLPPIISSINKRLLDGDRPGVVSFMPPQPYKLFTPGPITLSSRVKVPMMTDWGSREFEYIDLVERVKANLTKLATNGNPVGYTTVIMQGSGTFGVEATVTTAVPKDGKILVLENGEYGIRMTKIAKIAKKNVTSLSFDQKEIPHPAQVEEALKNDPSITHVGFIHSETTTGILNPLREIMAVIKKYKKESIVDAMSSFGGIPIDAKELDIDWLVSSSNKNIQGIPGFSFAICKEEVLKKCAGNATTLSLDLYDQWNYSLKNKGGFRFTSPVHAIKVLDEAINELRDEGGVEARFKRYSGLQKQLQNGMNELNFKEIDLKGYQGPIITTFHSPTDPGYNFKKFYDNLREKRCVIYPGKLTKEDTFRIGSIGYLFKDDMEDLLKKVRESIFWEQKKM